MLSKKIIDLCNSQGITLADLSKKVGIHPKTIYRWNRRIPRADVLVVVASELGTTVEDLLKED